MYKVFLILSLFLLQSLAVSGQNSAITIKPSYGLGYADATWFDPSNLSLGYQFNRNRVELNIQGGSKKRLVYSNGDFEDVLMSNYTITYSRLWTKKRFSFYPSLGLGHVSGRWKITQNGGFGWASEGKLLTGFGLNYGLALEFDILKWLSLNLCYNEALLLSDLTGNRSVLIGPVFKIFRKGKKEEEVKTL